LPKGEDQILRRQSANSKLCGTALVTAATRWLASWSCDLLLSRDVGIEAGWLTAEDARASGRSGLADRRPAPFEPLDADPHTALQHAARMEDIVVSAGITLEQVHHRVSVTREDTGPWTQRGIWLPCCVRCPLWLMSV
jgi:hypothetical protein